MPELIRILCVDDELHILNTIRRQLYEEDYEVHIALTAEDGLGILRRVSPVHVVLSDYRMPGVSGIEFLRSVSRDWPWTVGIIISGFADTHATKLAMDQREIFAFIPKPWKAEEMRKTLAEAVALSLTRFGKTERRR